MNGFEHNSKSETVRFGLFQVDRARFALTRGGHRIELQRISMEILLQLVEHPGILVTRQQLVQAVWPGADPEEKDQSVNTAITRIRSALRDDPGKPRYIETVIGKGYRFIAPLSTKPPDAAQTETSPARLSIAPPAAFVDPQSQTGPLQTQAAPALPRKHQWRFAALAASLLIGLTAFAWRWTRSHGQALQATQGVTLATLIPLTANFSDNHVQAAGISPDGAHVAFADDEGIRIAGSSEPAPVTLASVPLRLVDRIAWFPDGNRLLISGVGLSSGVPEVWMASRSVAMHPRLFRANAQSASVSADGSHVLFLSDGRHQLWDAGPDGSAPKLLLSGTVGDEFSDPTWFPDGRLILLQRRSQPTETARLLHANAPDRNLQASTLVLRESDGAILTESPLQIASPCILSDGAVLLLEDIFPHQPLVTMTIDLRTGRFLSSPRVVPIPAGYNVASVSAAPGGKIALILQTGKAGIFVANLTRSGHSLEASHPLGTPLYAAFPHGWTPDSRGVLFEQGADGRWQLMNQDIARHDAQPLTGVPLEGVMARLSPDHRWLLFYRKVREGELLQLFRVPYRNPAIATGTPPSAEPQLLSVPPGELRCPGTGTQCVLRTKDAALRQVVLLALNPSTGRTQPLRVLPWADASFGDWDVSPDGEEVVLVAGSNQPGELRIVSLYSQRERILHFPVAAPLIAVNWQATGKGWFASANAGSGATLYALDPNGKATPLRDTLTSTWAVPSPDGKALAYVDLNQDRNVWLTQWESTRLTGVAP